MSMNEWMIEAARHAQLPGAESLPASLPETPEEAWLTVCHACQLNPKAFAAIAARHFGLEMAETLNPARAVSGLLPESFARRHRVLPLAREDGHVVIATSAPPDKDLRDRLAAAVDGEPRFVFVPPAALALATLAHYETASRPAAPLLLDDRPGDAYELASQGAAADPADVDAAPVVRLTNLMLAEAIRLNASDIHLQPLHGAGNLRFRIDGELRRMAFMPRSVMRRVTGRLKALSGMDPTSSVRPQDGSAFVVHEGSTYDLRLSSIPVEGGEKVVVRFLPQARIQGLDSIGLGEPEYTQLSQALGRGSGLVLVTGPTGSGKTTTLHSAIADRNTTERSIVTIEDPVEYRVPRLAQVQVNARAGITFASALRAVLRQDPDIVLVGEIRDAETAALAAQAALTGQLVLSTLHTLDAVSAIPRLADLGVQRSLLGESLAGVMAQRLVRRLCPHCRAPAVQPLAAAERTLVESLGVERPMRAMGCAACAFTGYHGRVLVAQVLTVTQDMRHLIAEGAPMDTLRAAARMGSMRTLSDSALDYIRSGETSVQAVLAELGIDFWIALGIPPVPAFPRDRQAADPRPKVLLVGLDATLRDVVHGALEPVGYLLEDVADPQAARVSIERNGDFSAMVIDLAGQVGEKVERLMHLRDSLPGAAMAVVALSDERSAAIDQAVNAHGHTTLLTKPVRPDELMAQLHAEVGSA
jgi:type II secretory ATPase GspE/PulE/Tfp pilus assembly ATPase PilB-like protein